MNLADLLQGVQDESSLDDSLISLLGNIKTQLDQVLSGTSIPPAVQTQIDAIFSQVSSNKQKVTDAITANTPAATPAS